MSRGSSGAWDRRQPGSDFRVGGLVVLAVLAGGGLRGAAQESPAPDPPAKVPADRVAAALRVLAAQPRRPHPPRLDELDGAPVLVATAHAPAPRPPPEHASGRALVHARAEAEARDALHRFADDALARVRANPWVARQVHDAVDAAGVVAGRRSLPSGDALVRVAVPLVALRRASGPLRPRLPWGPTG